MKKLTLRAAAVAAAFAVGLSFASIAVVAADAPNPVALKDGKAALSPENTRVEFVCAHRGPKPDPRVGTFAKFTGAAEVDKASKELKGLALEFDTNSITTEFGKLTAHLKNADFFDTREHPKASFVSKKIVAGAKPGDYTVTGDLTLHGVTKSVKAPVTVAVSDAGVTLTSKFAIDRSEFGMNYGADKVENTVALTVVIGEKNKVFTESN